MSDGAPPPPVERRHWERRVVLLLVPVGVGVALLVGLLLGLGGGSDRDRGPWITAPLPALDRAARDREAGIGVRVPDGWRRRPLEGGVRLRSASRGAELVVIAAAITGRRGLVLDQATDAVRSGYSDVEVLEREDGGRIAGQKARRVVIAASNERGQRLRMLLAAVSGSEHTYLIQAFNAAAAPRSELVALQLALNSLVLD